MAVVALIVVAVAGAVGVPVALARRRRAATTPAGATTVWTAATRRPPWLPPTDAAAPPTAPPTAPTAAPDPPPAPATVPAPAHAAPAPPRDRPFPPPGPCDWELRLATGGQVIVLRRAARGRPCCVHTLSLTWQDWPPGTDRDDRGLTWSGDTTRTDRAGARSPTRQAHTTHRVAPRGPGLAARTTIVREPGPDVTTPWSSTSDDDPPGTERLWTAHTRSLRAAGARPRPDDTTVAATLDVVDRLHVRVDVDRGCSTGGHRLAARARTGIEVTGDVRGTADARCRVPAVAAWTEGDVQVAATSTATTAPGTTVLPLPDGLVTPVSAARQRAVSVDGDPTGVEASLVGTTGTTIGDAGLDLRLGGLALLELALGAVERSTAEARLDVVLHHRVAIVVTPAASESACACRPSWGLQLGGEVVVEPSTSPLGRLVVGDQELALHRATGIGPPGAVWVVPAGG